MVFGAITALTVLLLFSLRAESATTDKEQCLTCTCSGCTPLHFQRKCCYDFDESGFTALRVSVDCSAPARADVMAPSRPLKRSSAQCGGYTLRRDHSCLTQFPHHHCRYNETRVVSFVNNSIAHIPDLQCLPWLGKLDLRHNRLSSIPEDAFLGVPYLRHILLDYNEITHIHPNAFEADLPNLQILSVSYNRLVTFEANFVGVLHRFCALNFSHNLITGINNTNDFQLDSDENYGPGFVDMTYNLMTEGPMTALKALGITTFEFYFSKFMEWGFDLRHNPFHCDCNMFDVAFVIRTIMNGSMWRDYFNITCATPPELNKIPVYELRDKQLTCDVTEGCPKGCRCEQVRKKRGKIVHVNCDAVGMTSLPRVMPKGRRLKLNMTNNALRTLAARRYLSRAVSLDLRGNGLTEIADSVPHLLRKVRRVDLRDNDLTHLPETIQALRPDVLLLDLHTLRCSCELAWAKDWLSLSRDSHLQDLTCSTENGRRVLLATAEDKDLGCYQPADERLADYKTALIIGSVSLVGVAVLLVVFRYELLVLGQHLAARSKTRPPVSSSRYQVFVSVNADSAEDCRWVRDVLLPALDHHGLSSFLPPRDTLPGSVEMDDVTKHLQRSSAALVVVSPDYVGSGPCLFQFSQAYSHMLAHRHGPLLVVQLSPVSRRAAREPRLRAMLTLRLFHSADPPRLYAALASLLPAASKGDKTDAAATDEPTFDTW